MFLHVIMMMMSCFCGMVDQRKVFSLISSRYHWQRVSPSQISNTPQRIWTRAELEFSLFLMKLCSSDNHCKASLNKASFVKYYHLGIFSRLVLYLELKLLAGRVINFQKWDKVLQGNLSYVLILHKDGTV